MENETPEANEDRDEEFIPMRHNIKLSDFAYGTFNADGIDYKFKFASLSSRIWAYLIDCLIMFVPISILDFIVVDYSFVGSWIGITFINLIIWTLYYGLTESSKDQATLGKNMFGLKVINEEGEAPTFKTAALRFLASGFSILFFGLGIFAISTDDKKQGWHDTLMGCYVIKVVTGKDNQM